MKLWKLAPAAAALAGLGILVGAGPAFATMPMGKKAKEAGFADAAKCTYCHGEALPKKGAVTLNERGKWLVAEKDKRKAAEVDAAWLKEYKEPEKK
ncbi:MAG TPA: hypothetical protein VFM88_08335 [Vicinamibacteria bacterium]|nr:hypothetical protein [Vicinamibacteria bacterium]